MMALNDFMIGILLSERSSVHVCLGVGLISAEIEMRYICATLNSLTVAEWMDVSPGGGDANEAHASLRER